MACAPDSDGKGESSGPQGSVKADFDQKGMRPWRRWPPNG